MRVNELAMKVGVTPDTVRFYTRIGLLNPAKNPGNGYKNYSIDDQKRLEFINKARRLGFSVKEIEEVVKLSTHGESPCCRVRTIVKTRLEEALRNIDELQQLTERMRLAVDAWEDEPDGEPGEDAICRLIDMWDDVALSQRPMDTESDI